MGLSKPNQQLRRDLKEAATELKWTGVELFVISTRMLEAGDKQGALDLMRIAISFHETEDKLAAYAEEVKAGRVMRAKPGDI